jgi:hypothetical protein
MYSPGIASLFNGTECNFSGKFPIQSDVTLSILKPDHGSMQYSADYWMKCPEIDPNQ